MAKRLIFGVGAAVLMAPLYAYALPTIPVEATSHMPWERFTQAALDAICAHLGLCLTVIP